MKNILCSDDGFSLLELLVAMAILSMAVIPMLATQTTAIKNTIQLNDVFLARMVAENVLTELRLAEIPPQSGRSGGEEQQAGVDFIWVADIHNIQGQPLTTILLSVSKRGEEYPVYKVSGFRKQ